MKHQKTKRNFTYVYVLKAKILDKYYPYIFVCNKLSHNLIIDIFKRLNIGKKIPIFSDGAKVYKKLQLIGYNITPEKSMITNKIEGFNTFLRARNSYLVRKTTSYAKVTENLVLKLFINVFSYLKEKLNLNQSLKQRIIPSFLI